MTEEGLLRTRYRCDTKPTLVPPFGVGACTQWVNDGSPFSSLWKTLANLIIHEAVVDECDVVRERHVHHARRQQRKGLQRSVRPPYKRGRGGGGDEMSQQQVPTATPLVPLQPILYSSSALRASDSRNSPPL